MPNQPYQYKPDDTPLTVAQQFGIQPKDLINANPGGFPPSTGQTINIPNALQQIGNAIKNPKRDWFSILFDTAIPFNYNGQTIAPVNMDVKDVAKYAQTVPASTAPVYSQSQGHPNPGLYYASMNPEGYNNLTPDQKHAIDNLAAGGTPASGPVSDNNWTNNPALHIVQSNPNAKNRKSTFQTTEKWMLNLWRRKRRAAKGIGMDSNQAEPQTMTGFGVVDFRAGSG